MHVTNTFSMFYGNQAERQSAVLSFRYPIVFTAVNTFKANQGGGVTLQQTNMDVSGTLHFEDNSAKTGGAISLEDLCVVSRYDITVIDFTVRHV